MLSRKKDFIGRHMLTRPELQRPDREQLVGLVPVDGKSGLRGGSYLVADPAAPAPVEKLGWITSTCMSPNLGYPVALALLKGGPVRHGGKLFALNPLENQVVEIRATSPHFLGPEGVRLEA